jgi:hypothetical protein
LPGLCESAADFSGHLLYFIEYNAKEESSTNSLEYGGPFAQTTLLPHSPVCRPSPLSRRSPKARAVCLRELDPTFHQTSGSISDTIPQALRVLPSRTGRRSMCHSVVTLDEDTKCFTCVDAACYKGQMFGMADGGEATFRIHIEMFVQINRWIRHSVPCQCEEEKDQSLSSMEDRISSSRSSIMSRGRRAQLLTRDDVTEDAIHQYSPRRTSSGGLFEIPRLFSMPTVTVRIVIRAKTAASAVAGMA